ncbi:MAG: hypothetical protein J3Q66DRAFT_166176 [Benniella sp.]|nr:MAG: hypothetical protein J3Q66DRAFT_166176 [Benniella sp.]
MSSTDEGADSGAMKIAKKKMSLGKRISNFFTGGNSKSTETASQSSSSTKSSASSIHGSDMAHARNSTTSLAPIDELVTPPNRAHNVYIHQRSQSTPDKIGNSHNLSAAQSAKLEDQRLRKARDSGFEELDGKNRRHSSSIPVPRGPASRSSSPKPQSHSPASSIHSNHSSIYKGETMYIDQHVQQQQQQQHVRHSTYGNAMLSTSSPQLRVLSDKELHLSALQHQNQRHSFIGAELAHANPSSTSSPPSAPRRCSTPVSEPLISRVDREKASVCFQAPNTRKETFHRDANLDPVLSNMVQQHRRDIMASHRLSTANLPQPSLQQQYSPMLHQGGSPRVRTSLYMDDPMLMAREPRARRDSSGSQHLHFGSGMNSPSSPGPHASDAQMKRFSAASQQYHHHQQHHHHEQQHPYFSAGQRMSFTGSQGSLPQYASPSQGQHSPLAGPQRTSPKRASSAGTFPPQHHLGVSDYHVSPQVLHGSPSPSPNLGAVPTSAAPTTVAPEMSLKQQKQQLEQLQHLRIQQQQFLLQQQHQQQQLQHQLQQQMQAQSGVGLGLANVSLYPIQTQLPAVALTSVPSPLVLTPTYLQPQPKMVHLPNQQAVPMYAYRATAAPVAGYQ